MFRSPDTKAKTKHPLTFQQKVTEKIINHTPIPKEVAKMISEYSHPSFNTNCLSDDEMTLAKLTAILLNSHSMRNKQFFKKSLIRFFYASYPEYINNMEISHKGIDELKRLLKETLFFFHIPISAVIGLVSSPFVSALQTVVRKHPYHWQEIACQLVLLSKLTDDQINQFVTTCVSEYISVKARPSNNTYHTLLKLNGERYARGIMATHFKLQEWEGGSPAKRRLSIIEQFLMDSTNSHSRFYKILIEQLAEMNTLSNLVDDSNNIDMLTYHASQVFFKPATNKKEIDLDETPIFGQQRVFY